VKTEGNRQRHNVTSVSETEDGGKQNNERNKEIKQIVKGKRELRL
jgi:hypothetical protein